MPIYLLTANSSVEKVAAIEQQIRSAMPDVIKIASLDEIAQNAARDPNEQDYVLLVDDKSDRFENIFKVASQNRDHAYLILISDDISRDDYKRLVRTGHADWVSARAVPQEIIDVVSRRKAATQAISSRHATPVVLSFVPSAGGVGNTTLAVEMSVQLRKNKAIGKDRICIVDLDFQSSHLCDRLDMEPRLQIQEISSNPERLDEQLFNIFVSHHSSGVDLFAAPRTKFNFCELDIAALDRLFDMISMRYDLVIIDLPVAWFAWTSRVIGGSDGVLVTGINTISGLRQMAETLSIVRDSCRASSQIAVVVNRCEHRLIGGIVRRHNVEKVLGREKVFYVREDSMIAQGGDTGIPMTLTNISSKTAKEIALLGQFCASLRSSQLVSA